MSGSAQIQGLKEYHFGIVTKNDGGVLKDKARGAVFFKSETLSGGGEYPEPAQPSFPLAGGRGGGMFWVPQINDQIEVEVDRAMEHPVPKYIRMLYSSEDEINALFKVNYPFRMGWVTPAGHVLLFDNKEDALLLRLAHAIGTGFDWTKDGDELKTVVRDLMETIGRNVVRTVTGKLTETITAEVTRQVGGKLTEKFKASVIREIADGLREKVGGNHETTAGGKLRETATTIEMNGNAGKVLTTVSDPVVDMIVGAPSTGVATVKAG